MKKESFSFYEEVRNTARLKTDIIENKYKIVNRDAILKVIFEKYEEFKRNVLKNDDTEDFLSGYSYAMSIHSHFVKSMLDDREFPYEEYLNFNMEHLIKFDILIGKNFKQNRKK